MNSGLCDVVRCGGSLKLVRPGHIQDGGYSTSGPVAMGIPAEHTPVLAGDMDAQTALDVGDLVS